VGACIVGGADKVCHTQIGHFFRVSKSQKGARANKQTDQCSGIVPFNLKSQLLAPNRERVRAQGTHPRLADKRPQIDRSYLDSVMYVRAHSPG